MTETCKTGEEHKSFTVLTTRHSLAMKYSDSIKILVKQLHGGDALSRCLNLIIATFLVIARPGDISNQLTRLGLTHRPTIQHNRRIWKMST